MKKRNYIVSYNTDKGIRKSTNQDALLMKVNDTSKGKVAFFVVCDGMGGLEQGELASSTVIRGLNSWYEETLPEILDEENVLIVESLKKKVYELNEKLLNYSYENNLRLGTTLTALLCLYDNYYILHVGDSRVYKVKESLEILTKDQTLVAREVARGNLSAKQAKNHPRRNVLLQCVGASKEMEPVISEGLLEDETVYMLCSDGLYHEISEEEMMEIFSPKANITEEMMNRNTEKAVTMVKDRMEKDNITVLLIKTY